MPEEPAAEKVQEKAPEIKIVKKQPSIITFEEKKQIPVAPPEPKPVPQFQQKTEDRRPQSKPIISFEPARVIEKKAEEIIKEVKTDEPAMPVSIDSESLERFSNNKKRSYFDKKPA